MWIEKTKALKIQIFFLLPRCSQKYVGDLNALMGCLRVYYSLPNKVVFKGVNNLPVTEYTTLTNSKINSSKLSLFFLFLFIWWWHMSRQKFLRIVFKFSLNCIPINTVREWLNILNCNSSTFLRARSFGFWCVISTTVSCLSIQAKMSQVIFHQKGDIINQSIICILFLGFIYSVQR